MEMQAQGVEVVNGLVWSGFEAKDWLSAVFNSKWSAKGTFEIVIHVYSDTSGCNRLVAASLADELQWFWKANFHLCFSVSL